MLPQQPPAEIVLWLWEIRDPLTGRWRRTTYRMTEDNAVARHGQEARKVEWSREVRRVDPMGGTTGSFLSGLPPSPAALRHRATGALPPCPPPDPAA